MSRLMAPSRAFLRSLQESQHPSRQCRQFLSSRSSPARRPALTRSLDQHQRHQPLVQKRFKFKSVEEAKSRYTIGVGISTSQPHASRASRQIRTANMVCACIYIYIAILNKSSLPVRRNSSRLDLVFRTREGTHAEEAHGRGEQGGRKAQGRRVVQPY